MRDLLKENCKYKLYLLELLELYENLKIEEKDKNYKKLYIQLISGIKELLNIKDEKNFEKSKDLLGGDNNE